MRERGRQHVCHCHYIIIRVFHSSVYFQQLEWARIGHGLAVAVRLLPSNVQSFTRSPDDDLGELQSEVSIDLAGRVFENLFPPRNHLDSFGRA